MLSLLSKALDAISAIWGFFSGRQERIAGQDAQKVKDLSKSLEIQQSMDRAAEAAPTTRPELETTLEQGKL